MVLQHEMTIPGLEAEFVGFRIPNKFVVGYGLDCALLPLCHDSLTCVS